MSLRDAGVTPVARGSFALNRSVAARPEIMNFETGQDGVVS